MDIFKMDKRYWILILLSMVVIFGFPIAFFTSYFTAFSFIELAQIVSAIGSIIFSIALAFLYLSLGIAQENQTELMEEQTKIQEKQNAILEKQVALDQTQFEPDIEILEATSDVKDPFLDRDENLYSVKLANTGEGVANHLNIWCVFLYNDGGIITVEDINLTYDKRRFNLRSALSSLLTEDQADSPKLRYYGGYLEPGDSAEFQTSVGFLGSENGIPAETILFSDVLNLLEENTINNLDIHLWLVYTDQTGQIHQEKIESGHFDVFRTETLHEAVGGPSGHFQLEDQKIVERIQDLNAFKNETSQYEL